MIDERKLIEDLQSLADKESMKCGEAVEMNLADVVVKYNHGEYCYVNAIETVRSQPQARTWIPCNEKLPSETGFYLVTTMIGGERSVDLSDFVKTSENHGHFNTDEVFAWQPLPNPYKE